MLKRISFQIGLHLILALFMAQFMACSSSKASNSTSSDTSQNTSSSATPILASNIVLSFLVAIQIDSDDDNLDFNINLDDVYELPFFLMSDGKVQVASQDIPRMVSRACATGSTRSNCSSYSDATGGLDLDLVIDACGRFVSDSACGNSDPTIHNGTFDNDGSMTIGDLSIRLRAFIVSDSQNGFDASDSDPGIVEMGRLVLDFDTDQDGVGTLVVQGQDYDGETIILSAAGTLSSTIPTLGGSDFTASMEGTLSPDPFSILE